ncbi:hypothetical protein [Edwardsiella tarda]|uniref:hypothetical protein n=1 Tax=Edwardsiella tarda TaxID=636 RepID=UPI003B50CFA7
MLRIGQVESTATSGGQYTDGNFAGGIAATRLRAAAFNAIQEELANIVESAGITLSPDDSTQVLAALNKQFQASDKTLTALAGLLTGANKLPYFTGNYTADQTDLTKVGRDIIAKATVTEVLEYLRLGAGAPPIGIPFFWPLSAMPDTVVDEWSDLVFLKLNNSSFSASTYPKLARVWPGLILTESRGEFIRTWDDGRGVDPGRALLSAQSDDLKSHGHVFSRTWALDGVDPTGGVYPVGADAQGKLVNTPTISTDNYGGSETRPRSIAFNFLVRAK